MIKRFPQNPFNSKYKHILLFEFDTFFTKEFWTNKLDFLKRKDVQYLTIKSNLPKEYSFDQNLKIGDVDVNSIIELFTKSYKTSFIDTGASFQQLIELAEIYSSDESIYIILDRDYEIGMIGFKENLIQESKDLYLNDETVFDHLSVVMGGEVSENLKKAVSNNFLYNGKK